MTRDILLLIGACAAGHSWASHGGMNCGCVWSENGEKCHGQCSVPVYHCEVCGDFDYGDNEEAAQRRRECADEHPERNALTLAGGEQ
jgi:hypothetical protein